MIEEPITDAIIKKINNEYYMFGTKLPNPNGNYMHIYKSSNFIGGYKEINIKTKPKIKVMIKEAIVLIS